MLEELQQLADNGLVYIRISDYTVTVYLYSRGVFFEGKAERTDNLQADLENAIHKCRLALINEFA